MKKILVIAIAVFALVCGAYAAANSAFDKADVNKDGTIDKKEFDDAVTKKFKEYDKNGDGVLDKSEMRAVQRKNKGVNVMREFRDMDKNGDGVVDLKEFRDAAKKRFEEHDRNGDGVLDRPEVDYRARYQDSESVMRPFSGFYF